jgi:acylphosphatase
MELIRVHVFIAGQVQGVGYRYHTQQVACRAKLNGWVRNLQDGRVEAVFEGDRTAIESMLRWCHQGSPSSQVSQVTVEYEPPEHLTDFQIYPTR